MFWLGRSFGRARQCVETRGGVNAWRFVLQRAGGRMFSPHTCLPPRCLSTVTPVAKPHSLCPSPMFPPPADFFIKLLLNDLMKRRINSAYIE